MRHCELCGKTSRMVGTRKLLRGHYNPTNWSRKYPNLQRTTTPATAGKPAGERVLACTTCIKTWSKKTRMAKNKATRATATAAKIAAKAAEAAKPKPEPKAKKEKAPKKEKPAKETKAEKTA